MITEKELLQQIKNLGIKEDDVITVHISLKSIGEIDTSEKTGAEVVIDALRAAVPEGLLLVPSHTYSNVRKVPVFNVRETMPCIGTMPCVAVEYANRAYDRGDRTCIRSLHPAHSMVAFGKNAVEYTKDDARACSPMPEFGGYRKLYTHKAKILLVGVDFTKNTFLHAVDEYIAPEDIDEVYPVTAIDYEGNAVVREVRNCGGDAETYNMYIPVLEKAGAITRGKLGNADVMVCDAVKTFETAAASWRELNHR